MTDTWQTICRYRAVEFALKSKLTPALKKPEPFLAHRTEVVVKQMQEVAYVTPGCVTKVLEEFL